MSVLRSSSTQHEIYWIGTSKSTLFNKLYWNCYKCHQIYYLSKQKITTEVDAICLSKCVIKCQRYSWWHCNGGITNVTFVFYLSSSLAVHNFCHCQCHKCTLRTVSEVCIRETGYLLVASEPAGCPFPAWKAKGRGNEQDNDRRSALHTLNAIEGPSDRATGKPSLEWTHANVPTQVINPCTKIYICIFNKQNTIQWEERIN
jgi:hypothetical protein